MPRWLDDLVREYLLEPGLNHCQALREVQHITDDLRSGNRIRRNVGLVLLCSGAGGAAVAFEEAGGHAKTFEKLNDSHNQGLLTPRGLLRAACLIVAVLPGGLVWASPPCATRLNFVSRGTMARGSGPDVLGPDTRTDVEEANALAMHLHPGLNKSIAGHCPAVLFEC